MSNVIIIPIMSYIFGLFCGILICCLCIALAEFTEKPDNTTHYLNIYPSPVDTYDIGEKAEKSARRIVAPKEGK
jgi:hypothetical protein